MKTRLLTLSGIVMLMILTACTAQVPATSVATESPTIVVKNTAPVQPTIVSETPTQTQPAAPVMEVGSSYYYADGTTLIAIPAGEFSMGAAGKDNTEHTVTLDDYWIYSTEVTNQQYALCETLGKCTSPNQDDNPGYKDIQFANHPVVGVTYEQASAYCSFLHGSLPTEAEWEKAARNPSGDPYPWGTTDPSCDLLNFKGCTDGASNVVSYPKGASYYGSLDMAGNVFEWVSDWYAADYYASSPKDNPQGPSSGTSRSVRSSSFASDGGQLAVTSRSSEDPAAHRPDLGFRCVVKEPTYFASSCTSPLVYGADGNATPSSTGACPDIKIQQGAYCVGKLPVTNITFQGPADSTFDAPNCTPSEKPNLFTCASPGTIVSITAGCQVDKATGQTVCPTGFSQKDNTCVANGRAGECLAGTYDQAQQCCNVPDSGDALSTSKVCPVGTFYAQGQDACLSYPVQEIVSITEHVIFLSCKETKSGGGGGKSCQLPPGSQCPQEYLWDTNLCCCRVEYDPNATDCQPVEPIPTQPPVQ